MDVKIVPDVIRYCSKQFMFLVANERGLDALGVTPRARIIALALAATDPVLMLWGGRDISIMLQHQKRERKSSCAQF